MSRLGATLLLALYPRDFRRRAGPEMARAFSACIHRERTRLGPAGVPYAWGRFLVDALVSAAAMRADTYRRRRLALHHQPAVPQGDTTMNSLW